MSDKPSAARRLLLLVLLALIVILVGLNVHLFLRRPVIQIYFVPEATFAAYEPHYRPTNYGFVWIYWNGRQQIHRARVLISATEVSQQKRDHLIWEEVTQSMGLLNDSYAYPDSIFYQDWSQVTGYAPVDRTVIEMLYREEIRPGMDGEEVERALGDSYTSAEMAYFVEIALAAEYGISGGRVHKWVDSPVVEVYGSPGEADLETLGQVIAALNGLTGGVQLSLDESRRDVTAQPAPVE